MASSMENGVKVSRLLTASGKGYDRMAGHYMTVVMEYGQMAGVPWVVVQDYNGAELARVNCAHVEELTLDPLKMRYPFESDLF